MKKMITPRTSLLLALSALLFLGADWTRFRGPEASGVSDDTGLPTTWSEDENIVWKTALPGFGSSSPTTLGNHIFLTSYSGYGLDRETPGEQDDLRLNILCIERTRGRIVWRKSSAARPPLAKYDGGRVNLHGYASATVATDGETLFAFFGRSGAVAYNLVGELLWHTLVGDGTHGWGSSNSPVLYGDLVILNASIESESIVALNKKTGEEVWRTDGIKSSWSTPLVVDTEDGSQELVVSMKNTILALDPSSGEQLWECDGVRDYTCPAVTAYDGIVYITGGRGPQFFAIRPGGRGNVTETHTLWEAKETSKVSTPVLYKGFLHWVDHTGIAYCADPASGEILYKERLDLQGPEDKLYASLVAADGKIFGVSRADGAFVLAPGPEFKILARNYLDSSVFNATPTISHGRLLLRSDRFLYCVGK